MGREGSRGGGAGEETGAAGKSRWSGLEGLDWVRRRLRSMAAVRAEAREGVGSDMSDIYRTISQTINIDPFWAYCCIAIVLMEVEKVEIVLPLY